MMNDAARSSRQFSLCMVMETIVHCGPISRASVAKQTGLSKQTISEIARSLEEDGWIRETGRTSGHVGRSAVTYEIVPDAACIAAVDLGGTKVRAAIADLSCRVLAELIEPTDKRGGIHVTRQIARLCREVAKRNSIDFTRVRLAVVGVPGVPDKKSGQIHMAPNISGFDELDVASNLKSELGLDVMFENDVNLAVTGEKWVGAGAGIDDLAYIALGTGIGAGIIVGGELVRGFANAAGELGFLPMGADPFEPESRRVGAFERVTATDGIRARYKELTGENADVPSIFDKAADGDAAAATVIDETARYVARAIATLAAVTNPGRIIMGGSIGSRPELVDRIRELVPLCSPAADRSCGVRVGRPGRNCRRCSNRPRPSACDPVFRWRTWSGNYTPTRRCEAIAGGGAMTNKPLNDKLATLVDRDHSLALLKGAVARQSITGNEANFVSYLDERMRDLTLEPRQTDFLPGRPNIWGERKGSGGGKRLLFIGHTDTVHVRGWEEHWKGTEREDPFGGAIVDGEIWGRGSGDLKAGICASLAALELLDRAGLKLKGDVAYAFVGDEESGEPETGISAGIKDFTKRCLAGEIAKPDFTIYVEPTRLSVFPAQMGFFIADVVVTGKSAYFGVPEQGIDALKAAHGVLSAIWNHSDEIAAKAAHSLVGRAFALVTEINGGGYIAVPGECRFSLIRKLLPQEKLNEAVAELEAAIRDSGQPDGIAIDISYPAGRDHSHGGSPAEIDPELPEVHSLSQALGAALPGRGEVAGAPYWSEAPFLINQIGCPAVYCAPGDITNCHTLEERVNVDEYVAGIVAFACFIASYCGTVDH